MIMKRILFLLSLISFCVVSCGPSKFAVPVETRYPSKAGVDLAGKVVSVVYLETDDENANSFNEAMADGFAYSLEQDYGTGEGSVGVYRMSASADVDYASRDTLFNILIDTGSDVVFLFDRLKMGTMVLSGKTSAANPPSEQFPYLCTGSMQYSVALHCFDGMDKTEQVKSFSGSNTARPDFYCSAEESSSELIKKAFDGLSEEGWNAGVTVSSPFKSQWKTEQYSIIYFDAAKWYTAAEYAEQHRWKEAMDIWIDLLDTRDLLRKACAEYNISVACLMLGDFNLALQWLDRSDEDNKLPVSDALRKRISARIS